MIVLLPTPLDTWQTHGDRKADVRSCTWACRRHWQVGVLHMDLYSCVCI